MYVQFLKRAAGLPALQVGKGGVVKFKGGDEGAIDSRKTSAADSCENRAPSTSESNSHEDRIANLEQKVARLESIIDQ